MISQVNDPVPGPTSSIFRGSFDVPIPATMAFASTRELGIIAPVS